MKKAAIDIGSNSILLSIADENGKVIEDYSNVTGLGKGIDKTGSFDKDSLKESLKVLQDYSNIIESHGIDKKTALVCATEASRKANDSFEFRKFVKEKFGLEIKVISPNGEAYYSALGASIGMNETYVIMDMGGASTEFIQYINGPFDVRDFISMEVGSVRANDHIKARDYHSWVEENIKKHKNKLKAFAKWPILCVAGTMTSLATMVEMFEKYEPEKIHMKTYTVASLKELKDSLDKKSVEDISKDYPYLGKRSQTIFSGLILAIDLLTFMEKEDFTISTNGLRHGLLKEGKIHEIHRSK